jgi:hypothetical protein
MKRFYLAALLLLPALEVNADTWMVEIQQTTIYPLRSTYTNTPTPITTKSYLLPTNISYECAAVADYINSTNTDATVSRQLAKCVHIKPNLTKPWSKK